MAPILFQRGPVTREFDPAGIRVVKRVLPTYDTGYYTPKRLPSHMKPLATFDYVPPLEYFCLKTLYPSVDSVNLGGHPRLIFNPEVHMAWLKGLIPFIASNARDADMKYVDPRLWATLIQLYSDLPLFFHTYTLPLSDTHLTQLQAIRSTPDFTLITVLDLSARREISDKTIGELKPLRNLCVLDLSLTRVGSWGVKKLSMCLAGKDDERIGPWGVRVWSLRGCKQVDRTVKDALVKFPLLCAVDLRDTSVTPSSHLPGFSPRPLAAHTTFYYPNPPLSWINGLCASFPDCRIFQSCAKESFHFLHINTLEYPECTPPIRSREDDGRDSSAGQGTVLALFPRGRQALYRTHELIQEEEMLYGSQMSKNERRDAFGPYDSEVFGRDAEELEYGDGLSRRRHSKDDFSDVHEDVSEHRPSEDDLSEVYYSDEDHSEGDLSEDDVCELDQDQDATEHTDSSLDLKSSQTTDSSMAGRKLFESENEVAAIVTTQNALEQKAVDFYDEDHSKDGLSESDVSELDQGQDGSKHTDSPLDLKSSQTEEPSMAGRKPFESENEVATIVTTRMASEQKAVQFYSKPDVRDWESGHRIQMEESDQATEMGSVGEMHKPIPQPRPTGVQWGLMFYREPPAYDSISHAEDVPASETGQHCHIKRNDQPVLAKKRKTGLGPAGLPKVLLSRQRAAQQELLVRDGRSRGSKDFGQPHTSMNPFLAKRPVQSRLSPTFGGFPSIPCSQKARPSRTTVSTGHLRTVVKSQPRSQPRSNTSTTPSTASDVPSTCNSVSCTTQKGTGISDSNGKTQVKKGAQIKQGKPFDMRAWASIRTNR